MWWYVAIFAVALLVGMSATRTQMQKPAGLGDINVPTAEVGREIPVLFGRCRMSGPNVVWYGHLRTVAVQKSGGKK